ncbi:hypothetical protein pwc_20 [Weissella phage PWc]|nr:hypothetical protein pwc_20 [Weissella phage PWc]
MEDRYYGSRYKNIVGSEAIIDTVTGDCVPVVVKNDCECVYITDIYGNSRYETVKSIIAYYHGGRIAGLNMWKEQYNNYIEKKKE